MLTVSRVRELFDYDPITGELAWRHSRIGIAAGKAGTKRPDGYIQVGIDRKHYVAHKVIWIWFHGKHPTGHLDHINGVRDDNRLHNLREATQSENMRNAGKHRDNTSGYKGVTKVGKKWAAQIQVNKKPKWLGTYATAEIAYAEYCRAAYELHGNFARIT